ncbi:hypothetical protein [Corynebacterium halotolerans]|uniref:hypothetical protein n=1 Tax=Corynebacterium halotolerans TaxID=225326 RepID=UPI003CE7ABC5
MSEGSSPNRRFDDSRGDRGPRRRPSGDSRSGGGRPRHGDSPRRDQEDRREGGRGYGRDTQRSSERGGNRNERRDDRRGGYGEDRGDRRSGRRDDRPGRPQRHGDGDRGGRDGQRRHAQRGGAERSGGARSGPQRSGFREERLNKRMAEPDLPGDIDIHDLDPMVLQDLRVLSKDNAEAVAKHMIMAAVLMDDDPQLALRHARAAKDRAGRVAVARETCGIAAYRAGEWKEALSELRAARRMSGGPGLLAVMADAERGLGRPEKALELGSSPEAKSLNREAAIELAIVLAGARQDLEQFDSAVVVLQRQNPDLQASGFPTLRLSYAYANALELAGRKDEARQWFSHAGEIDEDEITDAKDRLAALDTE